MTGEEPGVVLREDWSADGVCTLTLDRPAVHNALSIELREALAQALVTAAGDERARCTVITGAGSSFCAGMDTTQFGGDADHRRRLLAANDACFAALLAHPLPLVAAVNGPALGGGLAIACLCDLRLASPSATFGFPETRRGIPPSLGAALAALPPAVARDLALTGRTIGAPEALAVGLVSAVHDDVLALACERAAAIAAIPPRATSTTVRWARLEPAPDWRAQLARETALLHEVVGGERR